jgi:hypothetical protein
MALVANNSFSHIDIVKTTGVQVRGHEAHRLPMYHRVQTNIADTGRGIEMVSAPA